jgi:hypothetical protein
VSCVPVFVSHGISSRDDVPTERKKYNPLKKSEESLTERTRTLSAKYVESEALVLADQVMFFSLFSQNNAHGSKENIAGPTLLPEFFNYVTQLSLCQSLSLSRAPLSPSPSDSSFLFLSASLLYVLSSLFFSPIDIYSKRQRDSQRGGK